MKATTTGTMVTMAALIGVFKTIKDGHKEHVVKVVFANVALFATLTVVGQFLSWDVAAGLALIYLLHSVLNDGVAFINWFSQLAS